MYKILIKQEPKVCKKPKNPIIGYYESNFNGWAFYKECGKTIQSEDLSIIVEKFEQLLYTYPAKDLKLINDIDFMVSINGDDESCCGCADDIQPIEVTPSSKPLPKKPSAVIVKVLN